MTDEEILNLIGEALKEADPEKAALALSGAMTMESTLAQLGISSITALEIAGFIEERLDIRLPDDELAPLSTIGGLVGLIRRQLL